MITLNYRDSRPIYEQIKEGIRHLIIEGAIPHDEKLPSVRELASSLSINPNTIQRAYRELEQEGIIYSVPGRGSFAGMSDDARASHLDELYGRLADAVNSLLSSGAPPGDILKKVTELTHIYERKNDARDK